MSLNNKVGEFKDFSEARTKGEKHMSENASRQPNYRITDKSGTKIEYDGLFGSKKVSAARIARSARPADDDSRAADQAKLRRMKEDFAKGKEQRITHTSNYKRDLARYNEQLADYESQVGQYQRQVASDMKGDGYEPPTIQEP